MDSALSFRNSLSGFTLVPIDKITPVEIIPTQGPTVAVHLTACTISNAGTVGTEVRILRGTQPQWNVALGPGNSYTQTFMPFLNGAPNTPWQIECTVRAKVYVSFLGIKEMTF